MLTTVIDKFFKVFFVMIASLSEPGPGIFYFFKYYPSFDCDRNLVFVFTEAKYDYNVHVLNIYKDKYNVGIVDLIVFKPFQD